MNAICFDTETTGLHETEEDILQLSVVDTAGNTLYNGYFSPVRRSEWPEAEKINHITPKKVKNCPTFAQEKEKIQSIFDSADTLIGYNVDFDMKFLAAAGIDFSRFNDEQIVDVMKDFAPIYGQRSDSNRTTDGYKWQKLTVCAEHYGFDWSKVPAHNSLGDCLATVHCYSAMQLEKAIVEILDALPTDELIDVNNNWQIAIDSYDSFFHFKSDFRDFIEAYGFDNTELQKLKEFGDFNEGDPYFTFDNALGALYSFSERDMREVVSKDEIAHYINSTGDTLGLGDISAVIENWNNEPSRDDRPSVLKPLYEKQQGIAQQGKGGHGKDDPEL